MEIYDHQWHITHVNTHLACPSGQARDVDACAKNKVGGDFSIIPELYTMFKSHLHDVFDIFFFHFLFTCHGRMALTYYDTTDSPNHIATVNIIFFSLICSWTNFMISLPLLAYYANTIPFRLQEVENTRLNSSFMH